MLLFIYSCVSNTVRYLCRAVEFNASVTILVSVFVPSVYAW